jgi:hypothetical protein
MREAHFRAVDGAIARGLDDTEEIVVFRIEDDPLGDRLYRKLLEIVPDRSAPLSVWTAVP